MPGAQPGTILEADRDVGLLAATLEGAVRIGEVQPPGKQRMDSSAWILGRGATAGQRFE